MSMVGIISLVLSPVWVVSCGKIASAAEEGHSQTDIVGSTKTLLQSLNERAPPTPPLSSASAQEGDEMNIRPYAALLRAQGFVKSYESRAGGLRIVCFKHQFGNRKIEVQLWEDGKHRVSHFLRGRMSTIPTYFPSPLEMQGAIQHELTRRDHPPRQRHYGMLRAKP